MCGRQTFGGGGGAHQTRDGEGSTIRAINGDWQTFDGRSFACAHHGRVRRAREKRQYHGGAFGVFSIRRSSFGRGNARAELAEYNNMILVNRDIPIIYKVGRYSNYNIYNMYKHLNINITPYILIL